MTLAAPVIRMALALTAALAPVCTTFAADRPGVTTIAYFSSESYANNFKLLKNEFDAHLARAGDLRFQPYRNRADFERDLGSGHIRLVLVSSSHFRELNRQGSGLTALLVGERGGSPRQINLFWIRADTPLDKSDAPIVVASSRSPGYEAPFLPPTRTHRLLTVPKDIDALMAVAFGLADAAVATRSAGEAFLAANPHQVSKLIAVGESRVEPLPVVAAVDAADPRIQAAIRALLDMCESNDGRQRLSLLGFDRFCVPEGELIEELAP